MAAASDVNGSADSKPALPVDRTNNTTGTVAGTGTQRPQRRRPQKPNYAKIHAKPLPLETYPLPAFIPHSPLSLLRIAVTILTQFFSAPPSHPESPYIGYFSAESRSVHVTDAQHVRALWEMGFFGKGTLSRSEPSWLDREKARVKAVAGSGSAEEATRKRREERRLFKLERARAERQMIEEQQRREKALAEGKVLEEEEASVEQPQSGVESSELEAQAPASQASHEDQAPAPPSVQAVESTKETKQVRVSEEPPMIKEIEGREPSAEAEITVNEEHLQLTLEEAFFLSYGLGVLDIRQHPATKAVPPLNLFALCRQHSYFPPATDTAQLHPDDPFLVNYAVYHYYRSLGWVVRPGVKFSADYMLYNRGPVFSHAEFGVLIIPEYAPETPESERRAGPKDWWLLHCINRVQSQVRKSLVICYVEIPSAQALEKVGTEDIGAVLRQYRIREFVIRRWVANRSRD